MDLYSQGQSIIQANQLTEAAREANLAAKDFNNTLAAQLDEANDELDAAAAENQAINMFKGVSSGGKLVGLAVGSKTAKDAAAAAKSKLKKATTLVPKSVTAAGEEGLENITDTESLRRAAAEVDTTVSDTIAGGNARFRVGGSTLLQQAVEEGRPIIGVAVPTDEVVARSAAARLRRTPTAAETRAAPAAVDESLEGATSTDRAARSGIQTSAGTVGEAFVEDSRNADRVAAESGIWRELGGPGAKAVKGTTESALDAALKGGAKLGVEQFAKTAVAGVGAGLDIYKDIQNGWKFNNWKQELGNIGNIVGSALEIGGALTSWTGLGVGAEALGAVISVGSTALETAGDIAATEQKKEKQESDILGQTRGGAAAAAQDLVVGRSN